MSTELVARPDTAAVSLFAGATPAEMIAAATEAADALHDVIRQKHLYQGIGRREHVLVEGWQACGTLAGVYAVKDGGVRQLDWPELREQEEDEPLLAAQDNGLAYGYVAAYRAVKDGQEVGWGEGRCTRSERNWVSRDDYALSSMAQTRGQSRALRQPLGWIVSLAGYATAPAEEMTGTASDDDQPVGPVITFADDETYLAAVQAAQAVRPDLDGGGLVLELVKAFGFEEGLPELAARTLKAFKWWADQAAAGSERASTPSEPGDPRATDPNYPLD